MSKTRTLARIAMYHADFQITTDFKTYKVYRLYTTLESDGIHKHKTLVQKCRNMSECLAFIIDYERIANIGTGRIS